jgi:hypothetical protein
MGLVSPIVLLVGWNLWSDAFFACTGGHTYCPRYEPLPTSMDVLRVGLLAVALAAAWTGLVMWRDRTQLKRLWPIDVAASFLLAWIFDWYMVPSRGEYLELGFLVVLLALQALFLLLAGGANLMWASRRHKNGESANIVLHVTASMAWLTPLCWFTMAWLIKH